MKNVKFWLVQIAMVALVSLIFGSPVLAGKGDVNRSEKAQGGIKNPIALDKANANINAYAGAESSGSTAGEGEGEGEVGGEGEGEAEECVPTFSTPCP
jgi:hypothetical protein